MIGGKACRRGWDEGATAVEAAITLSILLVLLIGIFNFGTALWQLNTMQLAVQDAGRYVMVTYASGGSCSTSCAVSQMQASLVTAPGTVSTTCTGAPAADQICLSASSTTSSTPLTMTLTASYGFNVIGLSSTYVLTSQGTFPLD